MGQAWVTLSGLFHWVATTGPGGFMTLNDSLRSMIFDHVASHMTSVQKVQPNDKRTSHVMFSHHIKGLTIMTWLLGFD